MIDGRRSYRIYLSTEEEVNLFRDFMIRNNGDKGVFKEGFLKPDELYEVSEELKCRYLHLHGSASLGYPASTTYTHNLKGFIFWYENRYLPFADKEIIKHIPHASLDFPKGYDHLALSNVFYDYKLELYKMADLFVDKLFNFVEGVEVKAKYSRMYCDVERYRDDDKEPMAKLGLGYIYTRSIYTGYRYRRHDEYYGYDLDGDVYKYYNDHHELLTNETKKILKKGKKVLILDLHSFSDEQARLLGNKGPFPDICIGLNDVKYDKRIIDTIIEWIEYKGYSYKINYPYKGSIIPHGLTKEELKNVTSIMIEVNKRLYL